LRRAHHGEKGGRRALPGLWPRLRRPAGGLAALRAVLPHRVRAYLWPQGRQEAQALQRNAQVRPVQLRKTIKRGENMKKSYLRAALCLCLVALLFLPARAVSWERVGEYHEG